MGNNVFISYKAEECQQANWVRTRLESSGIPCWMAPESIPGGTSYATEIPKAIGECKAFVLILSNASMNSKWVPREVDQAINREKPILPFVIEDCPLTDQFQFYLANVQSYMAFQNRDESIQRLIQRIQAILSEDSGPDEGLPPAPPPPPPADPTQVKIDRMSLASLILSLLVLPAPIGLVLGARGLKRVEKNGKSGRIAAAFGVVLGIFNTISMFAMGPVGIIAAALMLLITILATRKKKKRKDDWK